jgi:hypothetical protein
VRGVRRPNWREFTRTSQLGKHDGVAPVGFDAVAGRSWNEARSYRIAEVSSFYDLSIDAITTAARFVAQVQCGTIHVEQFRKDRWRIVNRMVA